MKNESVPERINEIMQSLDDVQRAAADPYFYTKLYGRLNSEETVWTKLAGFLSRPVIALSLCLILMGLNGFIIYNSSRDGSSEKTDQLTSMAQEYNFETFSLLEQNGNQP